MAQGKITINCTLDKIVSAKTGDTLHLVLDGYTTPEDIADLYRMRGKNVAVCLVDPEQPLPLEYEPCDEAPEEVAMGGLMLVE